ncbi:hypothetical protein FACS1894172_00180 [Spirochaetia bacterium]|nr:hypothetical protein FACS1894164_06480 [Spirochaetia bacterium]GHU29321.1 hypothetical protein FACS1894172_00180 [Spirochaetia bacterium]
MLLFYTGLSPQAFAQTNFSKNMRRVGYLVTQNGIVNPWYISGTTEHNGTVALHGDDFTGKRFDLILNEEPDRALDAFRAWIRARLCLGERTPEVAAYPAGAIVNENGDILFPPEWLVQLDCKAGGLWRTGAEQWIHPDRFGESADVFAAAAIAYRIFCKSAPFRGDSTLLQDIREAVFLPPELAAPGLDSRLTVCINDVFAGKAVKLVDFQEILGNSGSTASFFQPVAESHEIIMQREHFLKKQYASVKRKRFFKKNRSIIVGIAVAAAVLMVSAGTFINDRSHAPNVRGLSPEEVVSTYYNALSSMDHAVMDACLLDRHRDKTGKNDIDMVSGIFVITKMRQSYEVTTPPILMPAQDYADNGAPDIPKDRLIVFGVSDFVCQVEDADERDATVSFRTRYRLWNPSYSDEDPDSPVATPVNCEDELTLVRYKDMWQIAVINRIIDEDIHEYNKY